MKDTLYIGCYTYSSWSLRAWLLFKHFNVPVHIKRIDFAKENVAEALSEFFPAKTVPTLVTSNGEIIWDSLAIAEELASRYPKKKILPHSQDLRTIARNLASEMHSSFFALREQCPMNLQAAYSDFQPSDAVLKELKRIDFLWQWALEKSRGPWLAGEYSVADAFFAPIAARIAGYGLAVSETANKYIKMHLHDTAFRQWRAMGIASLEDLPKYNLSNTKKDWPGPKPLPAQISIEKESTNTFCPYSGKAVTDTLKLENGRIYGFCNPFCRDKTIADPEAWPDFIKLIRN